MYRYTFYIIFSQTILINYIPYALDKLQSARIVKKKIPVPVTVKEILDYIQK